MKLHFRPHLLAVLPLAWTLGLTFAEAQQLPRADNVMEMDDISKPPSGGVAPRPIGPRDITMANYPLESFVAGEEGTVSLRALVLADGAVESANIERSSGSVRLDNAAVDLVRTWRYQPATQDGVTVAARFPVNIDWKLLVLPYPLPLNSATSFRTEEHPSVSAVVKFLVSAKGELVATRLERSSGYADLDKVAVESVKSWRITPARLRDGSAVTMWMRTPILFASSSSSAEESAPPSDGVIELMDDRTTLPGVQLPVATNSHALRRGGYPPESIRRGEEGTVGVRYLILEDGTVGDIRLMKTSGYPRLDQAAFVQVSQWTFKPATRATIAIRVWATANYVFDLR
jgi:TonB family protein